MAHAASVFRSAVGLHRPVTRTDEVAADAQSERSSRSGDILVKSDTPYCHDARTDPAAHDESAAATALRHFQRGLLPSQMAGPEQRHDSRVVTRVWVMRDRPAETYRYGWYTGIFCRRSVPFVTFHPFVTGLSLPLRGRFWSSSRDIHRGARPVQGACTCRLFAGSRS